MLMDHTRIGYPTFSISSDHGVEAAYRAGMTPIAFCAKKTNPTIERWETIVFRSMRELPGVII